MKPLDPPPDRPLPPAGRLQLATEIVALYGRARWRLRRSDLPTALAELRTRAPAKPQSVSDSRALSLRLGEATTRTLATLPTDSRCLMSSLVLCGLLARRGIESKLVVAAMPGETFAAHAWVEHEGKPVLEPAFEPFVRLTEL